MADLAASEDWATASPCPGWSATDLAGHLRCTAEEAHRTALTRLTSRHGPAEALSEHALTTHNAAALRTLPRASAREHVDGFLKAADTYLALVEEPGRWELPAYTYGGKCWSVGNEVGVMAIEWHVHAWDLAASWGMEYRPLMPGALAEAFEAGMAYLHLGAASDPWAAVLAGTGRTCPHESTGHAAWSST